MSTQLPSLFVIGDSISIQYGPYLKRFTTGEFAYNRKGGPYIDTFTADNPTQQDPNGGDSGNVLEYLSSLQQRGFHCDWLLLNCGLHDIKRDSVEKHMQVILEDYKTNLQQILKLARQVANHVVWVRTTPVNDEQHQKHFPGFERRQRDVLSYNEAADKIWKHAGVPLLDLHQFTLQIEGDLYCDHVHFHGHIRALQGAFIAGSLITLKHTIK